MEVVEVAVACAAGACCWVGCFLVPKTCVLFTVLTDEHFEH